MRRRLLIFVSIIQSIIFLAHLFVYLTWRSFWGGPASSLWLKVLVGLLSISFVLASLRARYSFSVLTRIWYTLSAVWLGLGSFCLWAAVLCWTVYAFSIVFRLGWTPAHIADLIFGAAMLAALYGLMNANVFRVTRISVALANLPEQWRGRTAVLISDLHLGHVRNVSFLRRLVSRLSALQPNAVLIAGDLYDGTAVDFELLAQPWREWLAATHIPSGPFFGAYYITGNHEEFFGETEYLGPLRRAGVRLLDNNKVELDGLQLAGVHYRDATSPERYRSVLRGISLDRRCASVLLLHAPVRLAVAEEEGVSLQLSGHTHGGQFFPWTLFGKRVWGKLNHGLHSIGNLQIYISYGAGTWGPPIRLGTRPEIVVIRFE
ncbi:MAG TPA: metallophosphoesterase [Verrucomicrobiae bacterium]|nr:metallophosphoesterase [Verrucomicrobiae bacterium]